MNYELAKKLKDAGLKVEHYGDCGQTECFKDFCIPSLSELISACGDDISGMYATHTGWIAYKGLYDLESEGKTPEEAVANLWLAINNK